MNYRYLIFVALLCGFGASARAGEALVSFKRDIAPIFTHQCQSCHGPKKSKGKYRLDTLARLMKSGAGKMSPIIAGKPDQSEIYRRVTTSDEDDRMPQKARPLAANQVALIKQWIEQGAKFDGPAPAAPLSAYAVEAEDPPPPAVYPRPVPITALAFSPDGKTLAASGYNEITLWDSATGHPAGRIQNIPQRTLGLAYSPDGKYLAVAGGTPGSQGELRLIQLSDPSSNTLLEKISDTMTVVRFSPDGTRLAAGGADNAISIYDVATQKRVLFIEQHADWITDLAFSPDGASLASASRDKTCRVFDTKTGAMESTYVGAVELLFAVAWSDDGKRVFSAGRDRKIHVWNPLDGKAAGEIPAPSADLFHFCAADGLLYLSSADGTVGIYSQENLSTTETLVHFPDWAYALALNSSKHRIAAGCYDGTVKVWSIPDHKEIASFVAAPGHH